MTTLALIDQFGGWWNDLTLAKQMFYGIGIVAALVTVVMALLAAVGMDHHDGLDAGGLDHDGGIGVFSVKPLTGFFLAFGWVGGLALDNGFSLFAAVAFALLAGAGVMAVITVMFRTMLALKSDGTMQVKAALGAVGTVYVTVPANTGSGGQVVVNFSGRQETLAALSAAPSPIPSGEKIKVVSVVDGRTVLIEPL
jgi:membrane protein implicated in regulation of membrane protease activity